MRTLIILAACMSLVIPGVLAQGGDAPNSTRTTVLKVSGMQCGACAARVEKEAKKIDGVSRAKASQPKGTAEVTYDATKISAAEIAALVSERTGFTAEAPSAEQERK
jgi:copper chaperone CopZ